MEFSRQEYWSGLSFPTLEDLPNPSIGGVCNFLGSVSPQQKFEVMDEPSVIVQFYLASKGKYILEAWGRADPKDTNRSPWLNFGSSFYVFLLPLSLPYVNWASRRAGFYFFFSPEVLTPVLRPSFVLFSWAFPFFVFYPPPFWTPFSYSNYLTQRSNWHLSHLLPWQADSLLLCHLRSPKPYIKIL